MLRVALLGIGVLMLGSGPAVTADEPEIQHIKKIVREIEMGHPAAGRLGVGLEDVDAESAKDLKLGEEHGARIVRVVEDTPAAESGLKVDDVVVAYQGQRVESAAQLVRLVRETPPGRDVSLDVSRNGDVVTVHATLAAAADAKQVFKWSGGGDGEDFELTLPSMPNIPSVHPFMHGPHGRWMKDMPQAGCCARPRKLGIRFQEISGQLARYFKAKGDTAVLVTSVDEASPAAVAGLQAGDLILRLGDARIDSGSALLEAVEEAESGATLGVTVQREGKPLELEVVVGGREKEEERKPAKRSL